MKISKLVFVVAGLRITNAYAFELDDEGMFKITGQVDGTALSLAVPASAVSIEILP